MSSIPHNQNKENEVFEFAAKFICCACFFLAAALNLTTDRQSSIS